MTERWKRCARCNATLAEHEDREIDTCPEFTEELSFTERRLKDIEQTIDYDALARVYSVEIERLQREVDTLASRLLDANDALECWGAYDYELLLIAERMAVPTDENMEPLRVIGALLEKAYANGFADGLGVEVTDG